MIFNFFKTKASLFLTVVTFVSAYSQSKEDKAYIISKTNVDQLNDLAEDFNRIQKKYNTLNPKPDQKTTQGTFVGWSENGTPIYCSLENESAGQSSNIDDIKTGGNTGLDLDGSDIEIGVWDFGAVRDTHQEFDAAIINNIDVTSQANHVTHVAGILLASGVETEAQGMAPKSSLHVYHANGWNSGLAAWSASGGILSTHSYILSNPKENYELYGVYDNISSSWDAFSYNAPYHLIVTGASNNGDDGYNPNGSRYDLLSTNKLGKNTLVVGACYDVLNYTGASSVVQSAFTSWGPTDDWRIKPDITAVGVGLYSTRITSDTAYASANGCSYAAPVVTGGVALLQQYYNQLNDVYMLSATVKALVLSTADEAGAHDGPDFSNGWGLFNAEAAANVITNNGGTAFIDEVTLKNGETYSKTIAVDGTDTLKVTICWNDPAGTPLNSFTNDSTPMLVNDLDLRVANADETYMPWLLEPNNTYDNYSDAAIKGDNYRDNIEVVEVKDITSGVYTITVTHKDVLENDLQDFSIVISGLTDDETLTVSDFYNKDLKFTIYPSPVINNLQMSMIVDKVVIRDLMGKVILIFNGPLDSINLESLQSGIYFIEASINELTKIKKIVKK